jgi:hypothetical protein
VHSFQLAAHSIPRLECQKCLPLGNPFQLESPAFQSGQISPALIADCL